MKKKVKIYEVTSSDYGKGYFEAKNELEALRKAEQKHPGFKVAKYKGRPMVSYYKDVWR